MDFLDFGDKISSIIGGLLTLATALTSIAIYFRSQIQTTPRLYYKIETAFEKGVHIIFYNDGRKKIFIKDFIENYEPKILNNSKLSPFEVSILFKSGYHKLEIATNSENETIIDFDFIPPKNYFILLIAPKIPKTKIDFHAEFRDEGEVKEITNFHTDTSNLLIAILSLLLTILPIYLNFNSEKINDVEYLHEVAIDFVKRLLFVMLFLVFTLLPNWKRKMMLNSLWISLQHDIIIPTKNNSIIIFIVKKAKILKEMTLKFFRS